MPTIGTAELGLIIAGIAALLSFGVLILTLINQWKKLTSPPPLGSEYVTASELDRVEARLKAEIVRVDTAREVQTTNLDKYCRQQFHDLREQQQEILNKLAVVPLEFRKVLDEALKPINDRLERGTITMTQIATKLGTAPPQAGVGDE